MQASHLVRVVAAALSIAAVSLALMGAAWRGQPDTTPAHAAVVPMVGVPTGEYVDGVQVQRLPSITVTARRSDAR